MEADWVSSSGVRLFSLDNLALLEEEKRDANLFGLTALIEILS